MTNRRASRRDNDPVLDFDGVDAWTGGGRSAHLPMEENPFRFKITKGEPKIGQDSKKPYILWTCVVESGEHRGKKVLHNTTLQPQALGNLKGLIEACGVRPKSARASLVIKSLTGKSFRANVMDDEYNDKVKSVIDEYVIGGKRAAPVDDDEDEDEDDVEDEDEDEEEEEEAPPSRARRTSRASSRATASSRSSNGRRSRATVVEDDDDEDLDDLELDDL